MRESNELQVIHHLSTFVVSEKNSHHFLNGINFWHSDFSQPSSPALFVIFSTSIFDREIAQALAVLGVAVIVLLVILY